MKNSVIVLRVLLPEKRRSKQDGDRKNSKTNSARHQHHPELIETALILR